MVKVHWLMVLKSVTKGKKWILSCTNCLQVKIQLNG